MSSNDPVLVWFRQDLRLKDNPALHAAAQTGAPVIALYVLDDDTPGQWAMGGASRWWLHHALAGLESSLQKLGGTLVLRHGQVDVILEEICETCSVRSVFWNRRYDAESVKRDTAIKAQLRKHGRNVETFNASLLFEPWEVTTKAGEPPKTFSSFWRNALNGASIPSPLPAPQEIRAPMTRVDSFALGDLALLPTKPDWSGGLQDAWSPGEAAAVELLEDFLDHTVQGYASNRDRPDVVGTSRLSPHLHFGEISPRMIWHACQHRIDRDGEALRKPIDKFLSEIGWREFSYSLLFHYDDLPIQPLRDQFANFPWADDPVSYDAWCKGQTGYPIVDAGMRELWQTGYMHNRVRMVAASFLTKHLLLPWQKGEEWFWDTLVDADLANNAASWQWVAGCGADAAPYFRIFNPILQGEKFDSEGTYVRRYIPELADLPAKWIHKPWEAPESVLKDAGVILGKTYPKPIVDHAYARQRALDAFAKTKAAVAV